MNKPLSKIRGLLSDLANAIDDAKDSGQVSDEGIDYLNGMETNLETLTKEFDEDFAELDTRERGDDDGREYADPRDEREEKL
jgi:hypothetical protein